ncbi:MAG: hypothetical protein PHO37_02685 [Kiritimatiellae bacterium]|nr:hypothetical protein [Kiritimatiellia bacterium]
MADICMDTNILADFLKQYFSPRKITEFVVEESIHMHHNHCQRINTLLRSHYRYQDSGEPPFGLLVASSVAFVELARKFDSIFKGQVTINQFAAFIDDPPPFFTIEPLGLDVLRQLVALPSCCKIRGKHKGIEAIDNLHAATACIREDCALAVTDAKLVAAYKKETLLVLV